MLAHSPQKENRSPQAKRRDKPTKEVKTVQELLQLLAVNNIHISAQLSSHILLSQGQDKQNKEIKLFNNPKSEDQLGKLKVKLADYEFQLKKMGEDFAEFQLLSKMEKDKCLRKVKEELQSERHKNVEDNSKWEKKFIERQREYVKDCEDYRQRVQEEFRRQNGENLAKMQAKHEDTVSRLHRQHEDAVKHMQKTLDELRTDFQHRLRKEKERHQSQVNTLKHTHEKIIKEKEEVFETKIIAAECQKKAEIRVIEQTKKQSTKLQEKYLHQIGTIQREKKKLQEKTDEYEMKHKVILKRYEDRGRQLEELKQKYTEDLSKAEHQRANAVQNARNQIAKEKVEFLRQQYAKGEQLELKLQKMTQLKEQMQNNYESLLRTLEIRFERRQSKREDIEAIREYQEQLLFKQRQNSQIYHQLRMVQLQKQNNDKIYTRIFTSNKKDKKSLSHKTDHDLHTLLKQSQTTDFRHLLKLSHK